LSTNVDFPEPDTPVMQIKVPRGNRTSIFLRLCSFAWIILREGVFFILRLWEGMGIFNFPVRYFPVMEFLDFKSPETLPQ